MDDSCAVCADSLEWVAYGSCGHKEVCSTCVVRLRFVLDDRRCCLCKIDSPTVFVTRAMGDFTKVADFSKFPSGATEGRAGDFWYHEDSQAFFDDVDQYRMVKAMCKLSCSVCESNIDERGHGEGGRRRPRFRSVEQLKGHLFHQHKLFMCSLCLEGRKVFISEQKLYTRAQLNQHTSTGDSEVDGSESERGGFMGHPLCEFCKSPFYGDNELYVHMSREHYTCHICQRQHPGQYDYFRNYDDLELHFRQEHYLCEDETCLSEKFVVFQSESELKRHNTIKHGGSMSRSKRNAALQIPTSFRYRSNVQEQRRGRGRFQPDTPQNELAMAIQASLETAHVNSRIRESSSRVTVGPRHGDASQVDSVSGSLESLNVASDVGSSFRPNTSPVLEESFFPSLSDSNPPHETTSRYAQALGSSGGSARLRQELFPPLPGALSSSMQETKQPGKTFAKQVAKHCKSSHKAAFSNDVRMAGYSASSQNWATPRLAAGATALNFPSLSQTMGATRPETSSSRPSSNIPQVKAGKKKRLPSPVPSNQLDSSKTEKLNHSSSAPDLLAHGKPNNLPSNSNLSIPSGTAESQSSKQPQPLLPDVHSANKSLIGKIRAALDMDNERFAAFKTISGEYRDGVIGTAEYLSYVQQFGLFHLIEDLARLCPDAQKRRELLDTYNTNILHGSIRQNGITITTTNRNASSKKKGKEKLESDTDATSSKDLLADSILSTVKRLQQNIRPQEEEKDSLSKDGYRNAKGKSTLPVSTAQELQRDSVNGARAGGTSKQSKKSSKFQKVRLGDGSAAALFDLGRTNISPERQDEKSNGQASSGLPVRGVWKNGGGQKLFSSPTRTK